MIFFFQTKGFRICDLELRKIIEAIQNQKKEDVVENDENLYEINSTFFMGID